MSYINQYTKRIYGGPGDQAGRTLTGMNSQTLPELLVVSATLNARKFWGPIKNGHLSIHLANITASGATSTFTVWYSNLPEPDPAVDAHWVQDTSIAAVDLTIVANTFINIGNVDACWVRLKPNVVTSAGTVWCWVRAEGVDHGSVA